MITKTMSVFLDYKCNFACNHCSVGSSPETEFEMPESVWERTIEQVQETDIELIVFTGGEVTLHKNRLLRSLRRADELGYTTRIVTNGWWAHDKENATAVIDELVDAGLNEISTSYDDFHTDFMDFEPVLNLIEVGIDSPLDNIALACIIGSENPKYDLERITDRIEERLGRAASDIDNLFLLEDNAAPVGSGAQLDVSNLSAKNSLELGCNDVISTVSVHPDGSVKACCGHAQFYHPDLTLGNVKFDPLPEIINRGQSNILYWLIHQIGPKELINRLDVEDGENYSNICHACHSLFENYREELIEFIEENRSELIRDDVLLSDNVKKQAEVLVEHHDDIVSNIEAIKEEEEE